MNTNNIDDYSSPVFLQKSKDLIGELKKKKPNEIAKLMKYPVKCKTGRDYKNMKAFDFKLLS